MPDLWGVLSPAASLCFCCTPWRPLDQVLVHRLVSFEVMARLDIRLNFVHGLQVGSKAFSCRLYLQ